MKHKEKIDALRQKVEDDLTTSKGISLVESL